MYPASYAPTTIPYGPTNRPPAVGRHTKCKVPRHPPTTKTAPTPNSQAPATTGKGPPTKNRPPQNPTATHPPPPHPPSRHPTTTNHNTNGTKLAPHPNQLIAITDENTHTLFDQYNI